MCTFFEILEKKCTFFKIKNKCPFFKILENRVHFSNFTKKCTFFEILQKKCTFLKFYKKGVHFSKLYKKSGHFSKFYKKSVHFPKLKKSVYFSKKCKFFQSIFCPSKKLDGITRYVVPYTLSDFSYSNDEKIRRNLKKMSEEICVDFQEITSDEKDNYNDNFFSVLNIHDGSRVFRIFDEDRNLDNFSFYSSL